MTGNSSKQHDGTSRQPSTLQIMFTEPRSDVPPLPTKEDVQASQQAFAARCTDDVLGRIKRAMANRFECGYAEAALVQAAMSGFDQRNRQLIQALERIEFLQGQLYRSTPKQTLQGLHDTGPEVEEIYDESKRGGSESGA